jgi:hypothetical protein
MIGMPFTLPLLSELACLALGITKYEYGAAYCVYFFAIR